MPPGPWRRALPARTVNQFEPPWSMAHEIAKLMLEQAGTFLEPTEAIRVAMTPELGDPLAVPALPQARESPPCQARPCPVFGLGPLRVVANWRRPTLPELMTMRVWSTVSSCNAPRRTPPPEPPPTCFHSVFLTRPLGSGRLACTARLSESPPLLEEPCLKVVSLSRLPHPIPRHFGCFSRARLEDKIVGREARTIDSP